jgi:hypothetical protein
MTDTLLSANLDVHYECLEMFPIKWPSARAGDPGSDCGILLEIWRTGGLFHSGVPIPEDALIELAPRERAIQAQVSSCEPDDHYGFLVQVSVNPNQYDNWFPESYCPASLQCDDQWIFRN